ncbi:MAG: 3-dehydroquinate synthase [Acidobacteria bacterium SCN 69-37]|nr:MAG: 3-dehydroquinate synthase [Acidobacteria bacterium SCN 69-37]
MDAIRQHVRVTFSFPVCFTTGVFDPGNRLLRDLIADTDDPKPASLVCVIDAGVAAAHPSLVAQVDAYCAAHADVLHLAADALIVPGGEAAKNDPAILASIHERIHAAALCRHSYVVAVGGGAVLDVAGYAAATAHRGIRLIRVPTTVLSQDDSGVGVKNGVNGFGTKNYFGTFAPPTAVINDVAFLTTLEDRDWLGGLSEAVKVALVKDAAFFADLERDAARLVARDPEAMRAVVRRSALLHATHISNGGDPFELGTSRPLDFGHWAAHRLEQLTHHALRHGEAVAIGLALDCTYSYLTGTLAEQDWRRVLDLLIALRLPIYTPELGRHLDPPDHPASVLRGLAEFREHLGGRLTILLLRSIGDAFDAHDIETEGMIRGIEVLQQIAAAGSTSVIGPRLQVAASIRGSS